MNVTASNNAGLASAATSFTVTPDSSVPTGQSVALFGGPYYTSLSVALTPTDGSDTGSGLDTSTRVYERDTGTLSNGACSGFPGTWGTTVSNPDASVVSGNCYRYRLKISDRVGNQSAASSASADAKVDTSAPSDPTFLYGSFSNAALIGGVVYYRPGAASGQFAVTASSTDAQSGIAGYTFPAAAGGWSRSIVGTTATYSHTGSPTDPAEPNNVTAQNNAGLSSNATSFTVTPDSSLPSSAIQCNGGACSAGWYTSSPVSVTLSANDTGSGLSQIKYTTDGSDPTLGNGTVYAGAVQRRGDRRPSSTGPGTTSATPRPSQTKLIQIDATAPTAPTPLVLGADERGCDRPDGLLQAGRRRRRHRHSLLDRRRVRRRLLRLPGARLRLERKPGGRQLLLQLHERSRRPGRAEQHRRRRTTPG